MLRSDMDQRRLHRYRDQSSRSRTAAIEEVRDGQWQRAEELLWGSLVGAVKAVGLSRGVELRGEEEVKRYATQLGREIGDKGIGDAFEHLASFSTVFSRVEDSRIGPDRLFRLVRRLNHTIERLWEILPSEDTSHHG